MAQTFYNNVAGMLSGTHSAVTTSLTLQAGHTFPDPGTDYYLATLILLDSSARETAWEIVRVTDVAGNVLTVVRAQEDTTAREWAGNSRIEVRLTAGATESKANLGTAAYTASTAYAPATGSSVYAPLASPALTGTPTAPTATPGDNDTSIATTAFVNAEIAADAVPASFLANQIGFRNKLINGAFDIWQRGDTRDVTNTNTEHGPDRWRAFNTSTGTLTVRKITDGPAPGDAGSTTTACCEAYCTATTSSPNTQLFQRIEGYNVASFGFGLAGTRYFAVSFEVKSNKTGVYSLAFANSGGTRSYVTTYTVSSAGTWERKTVTVPVDTTGTWLAGTSIGLQIGFTLGGAVAATTSTLNQWQAGNYNTANTQTNNLLDTLGNYLRLARVQLEAGAVATPFESRSFALEQALCRRYCRSSNFYVPATTAQNLGVIDMRATPTITGGGTGFTSTGTSADLLIAYQTTGGVSTLTLEAEL